jgi:tRNA-specific 2-thiouridylase
MSRVVLAMSGGVDSSVAAHLLLEAGHEVIGVFMRHGNESPVACETPDSQEAAGLPVLGDVNRLDHKQGCCSASDARDAARVADRLGIPFYALNLNQEFARIIDYFADEYSAGRTPNPCVMCNNWIKFGKLFDYADSVGAEFVATGHYARLTAEPVGSLALRRGRDGGKDQSYVLFGIQRELLPRMMLPVGNFEKPRIRELAAGLGLNVADKRDSQEICFVTSGHHGEFVRAHQAAVRGSPDHVQVADRRSPETPGDLRSEPRRGRETSAKQEFSAEQALRGPGDIVTTTGEVVGRHAGIESYTIGQRKGLGVAMGEPYFVTRIDPARNQVVIGRKEELARSELTANRTNWLVDPPRNSFACLAQIRYNSPARPATAELFGESPTCDKAHFRVTFDQPQYGVAPGQAVVLYDGDRVLGGGWIE